ncbi:MAG TPA: ABC transporter permease [Polyangiaceae bacterium]|nr:ABC transporter permease [Polyangiaceae bacterium]
MNQQLLVPSRGRRLDANLPEPSLAEPSEPSLAEPPRLYAEPTSRSRALGLRILVPLLLLLAWAVGSASGAIADNVLASPAEVARTGQRLIASGVLWHHLSLSLGRAALGLLVGGGLGLVLGTLAGLSKLAENLLDPTVQMVRAVPFLALVPLFIVWFGIGETSKILLIAAAAAKPMYLNAFGGARSVDKKLVEMARVFGLSRFSQVTELFLPAALPSLMVGLRLATSMSLIALIAVEVINTSRGIGFLMLQAQEFFKTGILVVCIVLYALFGLGTDLMVRVLERVFIPWRTQGRS